MVYYTDNSYICLYEDYTVHLCHIHSVLQGSDTDWNVVLLHETLNVMKWRSSEHLQWYKKIDTTGKVVHVVQKGDTLYRLSKVYNTTVEDIQGWNDMIDYLIEIGQELVVGESAE